MTIEPQIPARWLIVASYVLPTLVLALFLVLSIAPIHAFGYNNILPPFIYIAIYYWAIFRPSVLPPFLAFILGIIVDLITGGALGVNALIFVAMRRIVNVQRRFLMAQPFAAQWLIYCVVTFMGRGIQWGLFSLFAKSIIPPEPVAIGALFTVALFPLFYGIMHNVHRVIEMARESS